MELDRRLNEALENEWMNLGDTGLIKTDNIFANKTNDEIEQPHVHLLNILRNPDNFAFTCKWLFNRTLLPFQLAILRELWIRPFPMLVASRGAGKSFLLGLYSLLRAVFCQGSKIVIVGAAFRQSKNLANYCEEIWRGAPVLRDLCGDPRRNGPHHDADRWTITIGESRIVALPLGTGLTIRGERASVLIGEEFSAMPVEIFEDVVSGFAAVSLSPVEKVMAQSRLKAMRKLKIPVLDTETSVTGLSSNQTILAGTADYAFNHFCEYWRRYKAIIESRGDSDKLREMFGEELPQSFNWKDFSVIRLGHKFLPDGFMDEKHLGKQLATQHQSKYWREYCAIFPSDSNGFFRRSLIESCVCKSTRPIQLLSGEVSFGPMLRGHPGRWYVLGVDPASEQDNFSIVIVECWGDHRRVVYCWTTNRKGHVAKKKRGLSEDSDFYGYVARKIRDLTKLFPCSRIIMDSQGGGIAVMQALGRVENLKDGEKPIYPIIQEDKEEYTDNLAGEHILEMVQFSRADWVSEANHGMRFDFESKSLLFPEYDAAELGLAGEEDRYTGRIIEGEEGEEKVYDTLVDCIVEIEELKDELATIVHTQTPTTKRDHWDTPETKLAGGKKGRLRKDRYSALLMANMAARTLANAPLQPEWTSYGGFAKSLVKEKQQGRERSRHQNPEWYASKVGGNFGAVIKRG